MQKYNLDFNFPKSGPLKLAVRIGEPPHQIEKDGKTFWSPLVTIIHCPDGHENDPRHAEMIKPLWDALSYFYGFGAELFASGEPEKNLYKIGSAMGSGTLSGDKTWEFTGIFPMSVNFGDLCYSTTSDMDLEVTWRYQTCVEKPK